jgi:hypothetical protein
MKIVHLSDTPLSAAPYRLMKVQRIAGMDARLVCGVDTFGGRARLPWQDLLVSHNTRDEVVRLLNEADIIHIHNRWLNQKIFRLWPECLSIVNKKPKVLQYHSPRDSLMKDTPSSFALNCPKLVVAQYHVRLYPEATPVPNVVPIDDVWHTPEHTAPEHTPLRVCFSPSSFSDRGWDNKGYVATKAVLRAMSSIEHKIFHGLELPTLLLQRKGYHVSIDEVMTGSYHMVSLEALSQGQVAIANLDAKTIDALEIVTGTREHPWVIANIKNLREVLNRLDKDRDLLQTQCKLGRSYMEKYWDPFRVANLYKEAYKHA